MEDLFRIGQIVGAHGIRGAVKVYPTTDDPHRFLNMKTVLLAKEGEEAHVKEYKIQSASFHKNVVLLTLQGVTDRNTAETMVDLSLWVERKDALPLEEDEYYIKDLMECKVIDEDDQDCGTVTDVMFTGSNEVLVVTDAKGKEVLIPLINDCVLDVDTEAGIIRIHWMEGLR